MVDKRAKAAGLRHIHHSSTTLFAHAFLDADGSEGDSCAWPAGGPRTMLGRYAASTARTSKPGRAPPPGH